MTSLIYIQMMPNEQIIRFQGIAHFYGSDSEFS